MSRRSSYTPSSQQIQPSPSVFASPGIVNILSSSIHSAKTKLAATKTVEELQRQIEIRDASRVKKEPLSSMHAALPPHLRRSSLAKSNFAAAMVTMSIEPMVDASYLPSASKLSSSSISVSALQQAKSRAEEVASKLAAHKADIQSLSTEVDNTEINNTLELTNDEHIITNRAPTPVEIVSAELDEEIKADADAVLADALQRKKMREAAALHRKQRRASIASAAISAATGIIDGSDDGTYETYFGSESQSEYIGSESQSIRTTQKETSIQTQEETVKVSQKESKPEGKQSQMEAQQAVFPISEIPTVSQPSTKDVSLSNRMAASDFLKLRRNGKDVQRTSSGNGNDLQRTSSEQASTKSSQSLSLAQPPEPSLDPSPSTLPSTLPSTVIKNEKEALNSSSSQNGIQLTSTQKPINLPNTPQLPPIPPPPFLPDHEQRNTKRRPSFSGIVPKESAQSVQKAASGMTSNLIYNNTSSNSTLPTATSSSIMKPFTRMFAKEGLRSHAVARGVIMRPPPSHLAYSSTLMMPPTQGKWRSASPESVPFMPTIDSKEVDMVEQTLLKACEATNVPMPASIKSVLKMARSSQISSPLSGSQLFQNESSSRDSNGDSDSTTAATTAATTSSLISSPNGIQFNPLIAPFRSPNKGASSEQLDRGKDKVDDSAQAPIESIDNKKSENTNSATPIKKGVACFSVSTTSKASRGAYEGDESILSTSARSTSIVDEAQHFEASSENTVLDVEKQLEDEFVAKLRKLHPPLPPPLFMLNIKRPVNHDVLLAALTSGKDVDIPNTDKERAVPLTETIVSKVEETQLPLSESKQLEKVLVEKETVRTEAEALPLSKKPPAPVLKLTIVRNFRV
jgi:hypothetical protein